MTELWESVQTPVSAMDTVVANKFLGSITRAPTPSWTCVSPGRTRRTHLPGAMLGALGDLQEGTQNLDPAKPTLVYCVVGGRSRVAAELLSGRGFRKCTISPAASRASRVPRPPGPGV